MSAALRALAALGAVSALGAASPLELPAQVRLEFVVSSRAELDAYGRTRGVQLGIAAAGLLDSLEEALLAAAPAPEVIVALPLDELHLAQLRALPTKVRLTVLADRRYDAGLASLAKVGPRFVAVELAGPLDAARVAKLGALRHGSVALLRPDGVVTIDDVRLLGTLAARPALVIDVFGVAAALDGPCARCSLTIRAPRGALSAADVERLVRAKRLVRVRAMGGLDRASLPALAPLSPVDVQVWLPDAGDLDLRRVVRELRGDGRAP